MKRKMKNLTGQRLLQGLTGMVIAVSALVLPMHGFAESVAPQQVYLDPSQAEAAKRQVEADAKDNANPLPVASAQPKSEEQKPNVEVQKPEVKEQKPEAKEQKPEVKEQEPAAQKTIAPVAEKKIEEKKSAEKKMEAVKPAEDKKAAAPDVVTEEKITKEIKEEIKTETKTETKTEDVAPPAKKPVQLKRFGSAKDFMTHRTTVAEVLKDMKVNLDGRTVYPSPETKITDGMVIHVLGRKSFVSHEEVEVPFQTKIINDPELAFGTKQVEKAGVKGKDIVTYENITRIGYEQKIELDRRHVTAPVDEIVRQGVAQSILTPEGYMRYKKKIYGEATAYTWGGGASGTTSLGLWPKRGIVAVDPRMIPYYTKMYIPGYGMAMAGDTGGAIVGHRIDLFMDTLAECYQWGRRDVEIYILE